MFFALVEGKPVQAEPGLKGICKCCLSPVIPKCGTIKVWHWAHERNTACDSWSEGETLWHYQWKMNFDTRLWETIMTNNAEVHIADIRTDEGLVIEFQNSPLDSRVIQQREKFYGNKMLWVINGEEFKQNIFIYNIDEEHEKYFFKYFRPAVPPYYGWMYWFEGKSLTSELIDLFQKYGFEEIKEGIYASKKIELKVEPEPNDLRKAIARQVKMVVLENHLLTKHISGKKYFYRFKWKWFRNSWQVAKQPLFIDLNNGLMLYITQLNKYGFGTLRLIKKESFLIKYSTLFQAGINQDL